MPSTYNKIHRLKAQGWTWPNFLAQIEQASVHSIDEKTLYSNFRLPHRKPNKLLEETISLLHETFFPSPFPKEVEGLITLYNHLNSAKNLRTQEEDIELLERFVLAEIQQPESNPDSEAELKAKPESESEPKNEHSLRYARLCWLAANMAFDRIAYCRDNGLATKLAENQMSALKWFQQAKLAIEHCKQSQGINVEPFVIYKLTQNKLACYLNGLPSANRLDNNVLKGYIEDSGYIAETKTMLELEPFQWGIARNGLRFSSLLNNAQDCEYFFRALVIANKHFLDCDYQLPGGLSINQSDDFQWALTVIKDRDLINKLDNI
jgi:hypothetical protein